ncbi:beta-galactosidase [Nocardiopsis valliformis]|uniref:beta-galactosidase n=1 Tax=Nocardiopsis valliformis TaxID=239974 RepID=UPI000347A52D|nr:beta-galactosidase [Nocardiopsis valliformis]
MSVLWFGGDHNPEQWPEDVRVQDTELMRRAGVNLVTVGVFSWALLEPREGEFDFGWLDRELDRLDEAGVGVCLATPTASPPPWFGAAHPDAMPVTAQGVRLTHGSRDTYDVTAPAYRAACERIVRALAERYSAHPALRLWHVHNEYGTWSHSAHADRAFRQWLRRRHGDLTALNEAWTTAFWSQHYSDWEHVQTPRATQYLANPAHVLDFRRFLSDAMLDHYLAQRSVLKAANPAVPVTTNWAFGGWVPVDPWKWAEHVDLVAVDDYPSAPGAGAAAQTAFAADLARSYAARVPGGGRPWLLAEQAAGVVYTPGRTVAKAPGEIVRHSLSHVARGSRGAMFFQWRASRGGSEQWHSGMVPHAGPDSRIFREVCELGTALSRISEVADAPVQADAAITWDPESWWAMGAASLPDSGLDYLEAVRQVHRVLWRSGRTTDFVRPDRPLPELPLLVVPSLYLLSDRASEHLTDYVEGGGTLVVTPFSDIADPRGTVRTGGYPGALRELLGVRVEELRPAPDTELFDTGLGPVRGWTEAVRLTGAEAVAVHRSGPFPGEPVLTRNRRGSGTAWYLSVRLDDTALGALLAGIGPQGAGPDATADDLRPAPGPEGGPGAGEPGAGVEVVRRADGDLAWIFVLNHTETPFRVDSAPWGLAPGAVDLLTGSVAADLTVPGGGSAVLRGRLSP